MAEAVEAVAVDVVHGLDTYGIEDPGLRLSRWSRRAKER